METRRRNRRVQVASSDQSPGLGVYAPSVVRTQSKAANQAATLSSALGFGAQFAGGQIKRQQGIDAQAGAQAAMEGQFTDEELHTMEQSAAFVQGAQKVLAKQRIIEDTAAATEWYQTEFDKGAGLDDLRAGLNEFWSARYAGVSTGIAREIAPLMAAASDNLMKSHAKFQAVETQNRLTEAQGEVLYNALSTGEYDWDALRSEGNSVIGKDAMNSVAVATISEYAANTLDESVWSRPEFAMLRSNPTYRDSIADNIGKVRTARHKANEAATINEQGRAVAELGTLADSGSQSFPAAMARASQMDPASGISLVETDTQATALWARWLASASQPAEDSVNDMLWRQGKGAFIGKDSDRSAAAIRDANNRAQELADSGQIAAEDVPGVARAYLVERSVVNNWLPSDLKLQLEAHPSNEGAFMAGVELYDQFVAQDPDWLAERLDSDLTRTYRDYNRKLAETGDPQAALERVNTRDPQLYRQVPETDKATMVVEAIEELQDGPLWFGTGIEDNPRLRGLIKDDLQYYIEGGVPIEQAVQETVSNLKGRYVPVDGSMYRAGEWSNPARADDAVTLWKESVAEELGSTTLFGNPDTDNIVATPVPNRPGMVQFSIAGPLQSFGSMTQVPIADVEKSYKAYLAQKAVEAEDRSDEAIDQRAIDAYLGVPTEFEMEQPLLHHQLLKQREEMWNALTPQQREVMRARQRN